MQAMMRRAFSMCCFSLLQQRPPRFRFPPFNNTLPQDSFRSSHGRFNLRTRSSSNQLEPGYSRRWTAACSSSIRHAETLVASCSDVVVNKPELPNGLPPFELSSCDIRQQLAQSKDPLHELVTVLVFDLETTGFSRQSDRIIEIAFRDMGENSTFETLVNPERPIYNSHIHGIADHMVAKPGVPTMKELIPVMVKYIESRRKPGGHVVLVAHNARGFDVPFLKSEFERCSSQMPDDWLHVCSMNLIRQVLKEEGSKADPKVSLAALKERSGIESEGHRAMADVDALALILQRLGLEWEEMVWRLVEESFTVAELGCKKGKGAGSVKQKGSK